MKLSPVNLFIVSYRSKTTLGKGGAASGGPLSQEGDVAKGDASRSDLLKEGDIVSVCHLSLSEEEVSKILSPKVVVHPLRIQKVLPREM